MNTTATLGSLPEPGSARAWLLAARLPTLPVAVAPVLVGAAVASRTGELRWSAIVPLIGALFIQIGTNFANDVSDYEVRTTNAGSVLPAPCRVA
jgi:1,4-dihydroxy-2-naphthoate octaprenyltransferase